MSVTVDHQPLPADRLGLKTVGQVLQHLRRDNRLVLHLRIDGREPDRGRLKTIKKALVAEHTVFIETADPRAMAAGVLGDIEAQLTEAERIKAESTRLLQRNQLAPAIERLGGCFTTWQSVMESVAKVAQLLRLDLAAIPVQGRGIADMIEEFAAHLRDMRGALDERDFKGLSDLLLHRTTHACAHWREAIVSLRGAIAA